MCAFCAFLTDASQYHIPIVTFQKEQTFDKHFAKHEAVTAINLSLSPLSGYTDVLASPYTGYLHINPYYIRED